MKFLEIVKEIQNLKENEGYLVLVRCGIFFDAIGKDAVILAEKFSIGTEYKSSMYEMMQNVLYLNKIENSKRLYYLNKIDALLNCQRIYLRIMKNNHWIDEKKFEVAIVKLAEIGRIIGGLIKYYPKNNTK